jgi:hypothetical protein
LTLQPKQRFWMREEDGSRTGFLFLDYITRDSSDNFSLHVYNRRTSIQEVVKFNIEPDCYDYPTGKLKIEEPVVAVLARFPHPNILPCRLMRTEDGVSAVVRSYFRSTVDPLDLGIWSRIEVTRQVLRAVEHLHLLGIVHRDLVWRNIVVTQSGDRLLARVFDFDDSSLYGWDFSRDLCGPKGVIHLLNDGTPGCPKAEAAMARFKRQVMADHPRHAGELLQALKGLEQDLRAGGLGD